MKTENASNYLSNLVVIVAGGASAALGTVVFFGYLSGIETAYGWGHLTRMAVHTAAGFAVLGVGVIAFAWRDGRAEERGAPRWLPALIGVGAVMATLCLWQAMVAQERVQSHLPEVILAVGLLMGCAAGVDGPSDSNSAAPFEGDTPGERGAAEGGLRRRPYGHLGLQPAHR